MVNEKITPSSKIKVYWDDVPQNYSKELENRVQAHFSRKYNVDKKNVKVVYRAVKKDKNGNIVEITDAGVDNIMDVNYQRELMKQWLKNNEREVNFDRLVKLDDKINKGLDFTSKESRNRRWDIKWLEINNFLCFGDGNKVNFSSLSGLNVVNSIPENQGGKTTFNIDTIKFLLYGKTTKTETNSEIFNQFSGKDELNVRGMLTFYPDDIIIERKLSRKAKKEGGYTIKNTVNYYKLMPDGSEKKMDAEDATQTTLKITNAIGKEADFDITTLATMNNLESLIDTKPTENGKMLNRFIGLEIIDEKLAASREMYNDFNKTKVGNMHNIITLNEELEELDTKTVALQNLEESHGEKLEETKKQLETLNNEKDTLLSKKLPVDESLLNINTDTLKTKMGDITEKGKVMKESKKSLESEISTLEKISFDEDAHFEWSNKKIGYENELKNLENEEVQITKKIHSLENDQICPTCKRDLEDVDHSEDIKQAKLDLLSLGDGITSQRHLIAQAEEKLSEMAMAKANVDKKNNLELKRDKLDVELGGLRNDFKDLKNKLDSYNKNKEAIDTNKELDIKISKIKTDIAVAENLRENIQQKIQNIKVELATTQQTIETKKGLVKKIQGEEVVERIFKLYIEMMGKKGISKMVLRSVLPIINSELVRLMDDVCDFHIELNINEKNHVEYLLVKDGVIKSLKSGSGLERTISSIALRAVLGKMAYLPMPNFITFDEVLGKVANDNLEKMKSIFDKIRELYDMVFLITHNDLVKDWADKIITVKKVNNISELNIN
jgi:DNA repair exonuclease SbcCD ATPase subunit